MYLLDTNVIIDIIRGKYPALKEHFKATKMSAICIPAIVIAELEYGAQHSCNYIDNCKKFTNIVRNFNIIPFTETEAVIYGKVRQELAASGKIIGPNDLLIAATAISKNATLVTHNTAEFSRITGLSLADWTL